MITTDYKMPTHATASKLVLWKVLDLTVESLSAVEAGIHTIFPYWQRETMIVSHGNPRLNPSWAEPN